MVYVLIFLAVICRLLPHPWNFTPVLAVALFGGALLPRRPAYLVPIAALVLSDLALGYKFGWMNLVCYACFAAAVPLGRWLGRTRTWPHTFGAAIAGSTLFYLVTNFAVWLSPSFLYPHTGAGLAQCYLMALPFFRNSLAGDLFWSGTLFGLYDLAQYWVNARSARLYAAA